MPWKHLKARLWLRCALPAGLLVVSYAFRLEAQITASSEESSFVFLVVLGTLQDAGSPHIACKKDCCLHLFAHPDESRKVVSLGVVDAGNRKKFLFEATPDIARQIKYLRDFNWACDQETPDGIFLTHAHIGHYSGLMYLGKEGMDARQVPVFAMPGMKDFLEKNGPWSQLVARQNISLRLLREGEAVRLTSNLSVTPFAVPHRDEFSETVGFTIAGPSRKALFIPDIDKWSRWKKDIVEELKQVDYAFVDATFFDGKEINNRDMSEIPHPSVTESMALFSPLSPEERQKVVFIHLNHTNPLLDVGSEEYRLVIEAGFRVARMHEVFEL
jgi:pyrroloquinoline quinone biosynthesis protein B